MDFEWDPAKAASNFAKHQVRFADAAVSLEDPHGRSMPDPDTITEQRFIFLGADPGGRVLITIYTVRDDVTRIISSRKASRAERRMYEGDL